MDTDGRRQGMAQQPKKSEVVFVRMELELANRLRELAAEDERKLSPFIARILRRYVAEIDSAQGKK